MVNRRYKIVVLLLLLVFAPLTAQTYTLCVHLRGVKSSKGVMRVGVFKNRANAFTPMGGYQGKLEPASKGGMTFVFVLPSGTYAVGVVHDEKGRDDVVVKLQGVPRYGYALSGGAVKPDFDAASFRLQGSMTIELNMLYP